MNFIPEHLTALPGFAARQTEGVSSKNAKPQLLTMLPTLHCTKLSKIRQE
jgi:hypothetical protein